MLQPPDHSNRLLKNTHLLRCAHHSSLRRTVMYDSFLRISRALHLDVFDQPGNNYFFNNLQIEHYPLRCQVTLKTPSRTAL
jgi:hypothetical protein